ncbi:MAG: RloB domain-containing protein [Fusobacteriaceae bacterium]|nr:RloB domain-containing protein [Fusobacteriaceae bacterium]
MARKSGFKKQKTNILIVCEGITEKIYLDALKSKYRLSTVKIEVESAGGGSAIQVFETAHKKVVYEKRKSKDTKFEEIYCVFDNDNKNMNTEIIPAVNSMNKEGFFPLYSNMCLEMWLSMHYKDYKPKKYLNPNLAETDLKKFEPNFDKTNYNKEYYMENVSYALEKSKKLISQNIDFPKAIDQLKVNPYTNMAKLIERFEEEKMKSHK